MWQTCFWPSGLGFSFIFSVPKKTSIGNLLLAHVRGEWTAAWKCWSNPSGISLDLGPISWGKRSDPLGGISLNFNWNFSPSFPSLEQIPLRFSGILLATLPHAIGPRTHKSHLSSTRTSPGYDFPSTVCSDPCSSSEPQWAWNWRSSYSPPRGPPLRPEKKMQV